jgi:hypothetical protein
LILQHVDTDFVWYYNFPQAVINILVESMDYSIDDAIALVDEYKPAFRLLDKNAEPMVIARMIKGVPFYGVELR